MSDERQEIAERLRFFADNGVASWAIGAFLHSWINVDDIADDKGLTVTPESSLRTNSETLNKLANLIYPTCEMVEDEPYSCHCTACGRTKMYPLIGWNYCPNCGARIVEDK